MSAAPMYGDGTLAGGTLEWSPCTEAGFCACSPILRKVVDSTSSMNLCISTSLAELALDRHWNGQLGHRLCCRQPLLPGSVRRATCGSGYSDTGLRRERQSDPRYPAPSKTISAGACARTVLVGKSIIWKHPGREAVSCASGYSVSV